MIACTTGLAAVGPSLSGRAVVLPAWQLGARAGLGFEAANRGTASQAGGGPIIRTSLDRRLYSLELEGCYQATAGEGYWLNVGLGAVHLQELEETQGVVRLRQSLWAPSVGTSAGYDFALGENVALTVGLRLAAVFFSGPASPDEGTTTYGNVFSAGFSLGVNVGL